MQRSRRKVFNSSRSAARGTGVANRRCTALTVLSASGFSLPRAGMQKSGSKTVMAGQRGVPRVGLALAPLKDQRSHGSGIVPPHFPGNSPEELERRDHPFEDCLGALEGDRQDEGGVGVGPGGDQEGDEAAAVGEVDVDVPEIGFESFYREPAREDVSRSSRMGKKVKKRTGRPVCQARQHAQ